MCKQHILNFNYKMEHLENQNLNPQYALLGYNINVAKNIVKNMSDSKILSALPTKVIEINTLFFYTDKLSDKELDNLKLGESQKVDKETTQLEYSLHFLNHFDEIIKNKQNTNIVLYNTEILKLLDVSNLSIQLGFNPLYFHLDGQLIEMDDQVINEYCKRHELDGYINLNKPSIYLDYSNECLLYKNNDNLLTLCPTVYLINKKKYGLNHLKILGVISLTKKNKVYLEVSELTKLHNILFCTLSHLIELTDDVKTKADLTNHVLTFYENGKEYDFTKIYSHKNYLDALLINYTNINDVCEFECCVQDMIEIKTNVIPTKPNLEVFTNQIIENHAADKLFKIILNNFATQYDINSFLFNNYTQISTIPKFSELNNYIQQAQSMEDIKKIFKDLETEIINTLHANYKANQNNYKTTLNLINLQYIPTTLSYLSNQILSILETVTIDDVITIINGEDNPNLHKSIKAINNYFNVDSFYIDITFHQYKKPQSLLQDLLNDVTSHKHKPKINLDYLKIITKLNEDDMLKEEIKKIYSYIYDLYKSYIKGEILYGQLYDLLKIETLHNYLYQFAIQNEFNAPLVMNYNELTTQKDLNQYNIKTLKDLTLEEFGEQMKTIKLNILMNKTLNELANFLKLNQEYDNVKNFLMINIERFINHYLDNPNSELSLLMNDYDVDFSFVTVNIEKIYNDIIQHNTNEVMIDYIYKQLKQTLMNKSKILRLIKNKNLFEIYLQYLRHEINKADLEKAVFVNFNKKENKDVEKEKQVVNPPEEKEEPKKRRRRRSSDEKTEEFEM
jgi:hypothetical protein